MVLKQSPLSKALILFFFTGLLRLVFCPQRKRAPSLSSRKDCPPLSSCMCDCMEQQLLLLWDLLQYNDWSSLFQQYLWKTMAVGGHYFFHPDSLTPQSCCAAAGTLLSYTGSRYHFLFCLCAMGGKSKVKGKWRCASAHSLSYTWCSEAKMRLCLDQKNENNLPVKMQCCSFFL